MSEQNKERKKSVRFEFKTPRWYFRFWFPPGNMGPNMFRTNHRGFFLLTKPHARQSKKKQNKIKKTACDRQFFLGGEGGRGWGAKRGMVPYTLRAPLKSKKK